MCVGAAAASAFPSEEFPFWHAFFARFVRQGVLFSRSSLRVVRHAAPHGALNSASRKPSGEPGGEVDLNQPSTERRRSERVSESLPLIVRGIDLLGQPFEERTTTLAFNLHGCRYTSKHHLPRNTWVTLDLPQGSGARKRWIWWQRVRDGEFADHFAGARGMGAAAALDSRFFSDCRGAGKPGEYLGDRYCCRME